MVTADGFHLPFISTFDNIFAFDVVEHIKDYASFTLSLAGALSENGVLILSTPSKRFRIFPSFFTSCISVKWGHVRVGHSLEDFGKIPTLKADSISWNAPFYRRFYIALRIMWEICPSVSGRIIRIVAALDRRFSRGDQGYIFIRITKKCCHN